MDMKTANNDHEFRCIRTQTEATEKTDVLEIQGYAATFNSWTDEKIMGQFHERIRKGAFKQTIKDNDIRMLFNHDPNFILARNKKGNTQGSLELWEDETGLAFKAELNPDVGYARDIYNNIKRGDISQNSFMFDVLSDNWNEEFTKRELEKVKLYEVSPVTFPAYSSTSVSARSLFRNMGISYSEFMTSLLKLNRNIELNEEEKHALHEQIKIISGIIGLERSQDNGETHEELLTSINGLSMRQYTELKLMEVFNGNI